MEDPLLLAAKGKHTQRRCREVKTHLPTSKFLSEQLLTPELRCESDGENTENG